MISCCRATETRLHLTAYKSKHLIFSPFKLSKSATARPCKMHGRSVHFARRADNRKPGFLSSRCKKAGDHTQIWSPAVECVLCNSTPSRAALLNRATPDGRHW